MHSEQKELWALTAVKVPGRKIKVMAVMILISVLSFRVQRATFFDSSAIFIDASAMTRFWRLSFWAMRQYV